MASERGAQHSSNLETLLDQGFSVAAIGLRNQAVQAHESGEAAENSGSKSYYYARARILELTADRLQEALAGLNQRLSNIGQNPGT